MDSKWWLKQPVWKIWYSQIGSFSQILGYTINWLAGLLPSTVPHFWKEIRLAIEGAEILTQCCDKLAKSMPFGSTFMDGWRAGPSLLGCTVGSAGSKSYVWVGEIKPFTNHLLNSWPILVERKTSGGQQQCLCRGCPAWQFFGGWR